MAFNEEITVGTTATGFLSDEDYFKGTFSFPDSIRLKSVVGGDQDAVKMIVKDDLLQIARLRCSALLERQLG